MTASSRASTPRLPEWLVFQVLLPFVLALPPVGFAVFAFIAYTVYFYRKG